MLAFLGRNFTRNNVYLDKDKTLKYSGTKLQYSFNYYGEIKLGT